LQNKDIVSELFREVAPKIANREGGYTRIIRTGYRLGDNAEMCMIELVDFNEIYTNEKAKKNTRRSKKPATAKADTTEVVEDAVVEEVVETPEVVDTVEETPEAPAAEEASEETSEEK
jgi:large subunit ribosomal protein L17